MDFSDTVITRRHALLLTIKSKIKGIPSDDSTKSRFLVGTDTRKTFFVYEKNLVKLSKLTPVPHETNLF